MAKSSIDPLLDKPNEKKRKRKKKQEPVPYSKSNFWNADDLIDLVSGKKKSEEIAYQNLAGNTKPRNSEQKINVIPSLQDSYFLVPRIKSDDEEYINHSIKVNHSIKDAQKGGFLEALKQLSDEIHLLRKMKGWNSNTVTNKFESYTPVPASIPNKTGNEKNYRTPPTTETIPQQDNAIEKRERAYSLLNENRLTEAHEVYVQLIEDHSEIPAIYANATYATLNLGMHKKTIDLCDRAISMLSAKQSIGDFDEDERENLYVLLINKAIAHKKLADENAETENLGVAENCYLLALQLNQDGCYNSITQDCSVLEELIAFHSL